ncbi:MAG: HAD family phosphatase [Sphaerochaeta sp.]|nr:HAD family phosphatase [Sphaerochaeta sp.]
MKTARALIFDFNGTLFWDTAYHQKAWASIAEKYGKSPYTEGQMHMLNGRTNSETIAFLVGEKLPPGQVKAISEEKERLYIDMCRSSMPLSLAPGAVSLFERARKRGIKLAIATSAGPDNMQWYKRWFSLSSYFADHLIITDDSRRAGKPDPAIYLETLAALELEGSSCIVFEDTKNGILSASRAGIGTIYAIASDGADIGTTEAMGETHGLLSGFDQFVLE